MTSLLRPAKEAIAYRKRRAIAAKNPPILASVGRESADFSHGAAQAYEMQSAQKTIEEAFPPDH